MPSHSASPISVSSRTAAGGKCLNQSTCVCLFFASKHNPKMGFPGGAVVKNSTCQQRRRKRWGFDSWVEKTPCGKKWQPSPVFLPGESHGQRSLVGYSPWGLKELDTMEWLSTHTHTAQPKTKGTWEERIFGTVTSAIAPAITDSWGESSIQMI